MFIPFDQISQDSKIWVFQSVDTFNDEQKEVITNNLAAFTEEWKAHCQTLKASFDIRYNHFVILAADESFNATSGCSVDESVRVMTSLNSACGLNFFDRNKIAFLENDHIFFCTPTYLKENYKLNIWNESTLTFNNLVSIKKQLETSWIVPAGDTWLKRYIPKETVNI
jgi:DNA phosphorothioation-dependent restriction protein DptG